MTVYKGPEGATRVDMNIELAEAVVRLVEETIQHSKVMLDEIKATISAATASGCPLSRDEEDALHAPLHDYIVDALERIINCVAAPLTATAGTVNRQFVIGFND